VLTSRAYSCLVVPVPELEPVVRPRLARTAPTYLFRDQDGGPDEARTHAHVTLLAPFAGEGEIDDGMLRELDSFFADVTAFTFRLTAVGKFDGGATYLTPDPSGPFRRLTRQLVARFPEYPPFGGAYGEVMPHISVPVPADETPESVQADLEARLPITATAREAQLVWFEPEGMRVLARFPFSTSAA
jgi:hypothetical protein